MSEASIKQVLHVASCKSFGASEANENERRWDDEKIDRLNLIETNHYDKTRRHLDFEIGPDGEIHPLGYQEKTLDKRLKERLAELNFHEFKEGAKNAPNIAAKIILGGNHERTNELAFDSQEVDFSDEADNSHIHRMPEIENWAKDAYQWCADRFGRENIIGFEVHLDETSPHAHALIVPVGTTKRGRQKLMWSAHFGEHKSDYGKILEQMHTDLYNKVNCNYGLERGDSVKGRRVRHLAKDELDEYLKLKQQLEKAMKSLRTMKANLQAEIDAKQAELIRLQQQVADGKITVEQFEAQKRTLSKEINEKQVKLLEKDNIFREKERELATICKNLEAADSVVVFKSIKNDMTAPRITSKPPIWNVDKWIEKQNAEIEKAFNVSMAKMENHCISQISAAEKAIKKQFVVDYEQLGKLLRANERLTDENQALSSDLATFIALMVNETTLKFVYAVAAMLYQGKPVPSIGGGGSSSDLPWDGRKDDENEDAYRRRCMKAAFKHVANITSKRGRKIG